MGAVPVNYGWSLYASSKHALNGFFYSLQQELLAKKSAVSVTIASLSLIWTPDMESIWKDESMLIDAVAGTIENAAEGILDSYSTRPRTWTYPKFANYLQMAMWNYNPWYQELAIYNYNTDGYDANVAKFQQKVKITQQRRFSTGYNDNHNP